MALGRESELKILLSLKDKASEKLEGFNKRFGKIANNIAKGALLAGGAVAVGLGIKAVKGAADFEKQMNNVATIVDTTKENMVKMGKDVKKIATKMPVDIADLTAALYQVRSAGIDAADAMDVLTASAELGVAGLGTTEEATNLLTSAINVFSKQGYDANQIADILFKTVKAGKTTVAGLAQSFGMVAPIAGELNIDLMELQAATAALTTTGMSASIAQTQLRMTMSALLGPTGEMSELYEKIGVETGRELLETSDGLVDVFHRLKEATEGDDEALKKAFGSVEALNAVLALTSEDVGQSYIDTMASMTSGTNALKIAVEEQKKGMWAQYQLIKNQLNVALIDLGTKTLPTLGKAMESITGMIDTLQWLFGLWHGNVSATSDAMTELEVKIVTYMETFKEVIRILKEISTWAQKAIEGLSGVSFVKGVGGFLKEKLPKFQEGGIVPGPIGAPVPAIVHGGETIIPANKSAGIAITITGNTFMSDEEAAENIGNMIIERLKLQQKF